MEKIFAITLQNRKILYNILTKTPREQLLCIPEGFRNNIWWNIAHVVVTQQSLVYGLSDLPLRISDDLVQQFRRGTFPDGTATEEEIDHIAGFLFSTVEWTQQDYDNGVFQHFREFTTSNKVTLGSVEDALAFNVYHEGLHLGVILSIEKAVLSAIPRT